jgi:hypothetical protein
LEKAGMGALELLVQKAQAWHTGEKKFNLDSSP